MEFEQYLIDKGANINQKRVRFDNKPLIFKLPWKKYDILLPFYIKNKVNLEATDNDGNTLLIYTIKSRMPNLYIKAILNEKVNIEIKDYRATRNPDNSDDFMLTISMNLINNLGDRNNLFHKELDYYKEDYRKLSINLSSCKKLSEMTIRYIARKVAQCRFNSLGRI